MLGAISLGLFSLGVVGTVGQASVVSSSGELEDVHLGTLGSGSSDMITVVGSFDRRALHTSAVRSFDIRITIENGMKMPKDYPVEINLYGASSGQVFHTFEIDAPEPGEMSVSNFCLDAAGESKISYGSDMDDSSNSLRVEIEPEFCPCGMDVCFDPHLQGLRGQHVKWTGVDGGWYALVKDDEDDLQINVRTTAPLPEDFPDRQFITGVAILSQGHSLVVEVKDPYTVDTEGCSDGFSPCLANGGLSVSVDGEMIDSLTSPTNDAHLPGDIGLSSSNLPAECREFGGRKVWVRIQKDIDKSLRHLAAAKTFEAWMLSFNHMVAPEYCAAFVAKSDLSKVQSNQALMRIVTPTAVIRVSAGINHRSAGKRDRFGRDLPKLDFWQMSVGVEGLTLEHESLSGLLGETARVVLDAEGDEVMEGAEVLSGTIMDYHVSGADGTDFPLLHN